MALSMTPEQLEAYRATRRRRAAEDAERRRARAHAARRVAHEAAEVLRTWYGATEVILFGSLAEDEAFGMRSDIDLAARGLGRAHFAALGRLLALSPEFEFDLVDLDSCPQGLCDVILARGVAL